CDYSTCLVGCLERIDVGIAIGNNVVEAVSKLYRRKNTDSPWEEVGTLADVGC
ncbi:hypothetical protein LPJ55_005961, partial [Coemansia sp. RSA 990]